jgi:transposase
MYNVVMAENTPRAARNRNKPQRRKSSEADYSLVEFMQAFPDDAACLDRLWRDRFSKDGSHAFCARCDRERKFHRTRTRASYTCDSCGLHVHPQKGTIFERSSTSLHLWFYAMYLMASTRCGISAKQMERELGVTYKQAHKMMKRIRTLMGDDGEPLSGDVEIDETSIGGKPRWPHGESRYAASANRRAIGKAHALAKPTVLGMVERGGRIRFRVIPSRRGPALSREVRANVDPTAIILTDDWQAYKPLKGEFLDHRIINHSGGIYVEGDVHTNSIEGAFGNLKTGMRGVYKKVSPAYLQTYLDEYAWRHNAKRGPDALFAQLLDRATERKQAHG